MAQRMLLGALLSLILAIVGYSSPAPTTGFAPTIHLTSGSFRGISAGAPNNTEKWLGIPFAQPPVGSLRFKAPVPITFAPANVQNAIQFGNACPQAASDSLGAPIGEDCLFLNVGSCSVRLALKYNPNIGLAASRHYG